MSAPAPARSKAVNDELPLDSKLRPRPLNETQSRVREPGPFDGSSISPTSPIWSPSLWEVMQRVHAMPDCDFAFDLDNQSVVVLSRDGAYVVTSVPLPVSGGDGEPVRVLSLRKLPADAVPDEFELAQIGDETARRLLTEMATDWVVGSEPVIAIRDLPVPDGVTLDDHDPLAEKLREAAADAQAGTLDRATDDEDLGATFDRVWADFVGDLPQPVTASGSPAARLSQFRKVDTAALSALRSRLDTFWASTPSAKTQQAALAIKNEIRSALVASGLGEPEVQAMDELYSAGSRSARQRRGGGYVGEVVSGSYAVIDGATALALASLRSREAQRARLGMRVRRSA